MKYGSVCSGIEAATVAWHPLGWKPVFLAEIEKFPSSVLKHHYPDVPNAGDFTAIQNGHYDPIELLVGGTPCQDFSVAGLRAGMDGARGQLTVEFAHLAGRLRPRWMVWENVPGVLSIDGGRAFGTFLGLLGKLGYGIAYRILDAQHFGVPQRRRRVFVVGHLGDWRRAAAVLLERHSLSGYPPPRREKGQVAPTIPSRSLGGGGLGTDFDCDGGLIASTGDISHCLNAGGISANQRGELRERKVHGSLAASKSGKQFDGVMVAFQSSQSGVREVEAHATLDSNNGSRRHNGVMQGMAVRRLTPRECERLQGFPDDYTKISDKTADGPRYKALGNSMAVPVMSWIGKRIQAVENLNSGGK